MLERHLQAEPRPGLWALLTEFGGKDSPAAGRPLVAASFALNLALEPVRPPVVGPAPPGFHVANLLLHLAAAIVLGELVRRSLRRVTGLAEASTFVAFATASIWALHPVQTASVTYLSQRAEILVSLWILCALLALERADAALRAGRRRGRCWQIAGVVACWLAAVSKEVAAGLPILLFLYDRAFLAGSLGEAWRHRARFHLACAASWIATAALLATQPRSSSVALFASGLTPLNYLLTQAKALWVYLGLALWPQPLVFDFGWPVVPVASAADLLRTVPDYAPALVATMATVLGVAWLAWRHPRTGFAPLAALVVLAPSSSLLPVATEIMALHRLYLPLAAVVLGVVLAARSALARLPRRGRWRVAGCALVAVWLPLAQLTRAENRRFGSELAFWARNAALTPGNPRALANHGWLLFRHGRPAEARQQLDAAIRASRASVVPENPALALALGNAAAVELQLGHGERSRQLLDELYEHLRPLLAESRQSPALHLAAANTLVRAGRYPEAIQLQQQALEIFPGDRELRLGIAGVRLLEGNLRAARRDVSALLGAAPDSQAVTDLLVRMAQARGRADLVFRLRLGSSER